MPAASQPGTSGEVGLSAAWDGRIEWWTRRPKGSCGLSARSPRSLRAAGIPAWLFGGWGLDARIGQITREHGEVEFWVERIHAGRSKSLLVGAGATVLATQPPEEACEFMLDGVPFSTARCCHELLRHARHEGAVPALRNEGPWRPKDIADIEVLRGLAAPRP